MGWCTYLVDSERKIALPAGKVHREDIEYDYAVYKKFVNFLTEIPEIDLSEIKYKDLSLGLLKTLLNTFDLMTEVSSIRTPFYVLEYMYYHERDIPKFDFVTELPKGIKLLDFTE